MTGVRRSNHIKDFTLTHVKCMADFLYTGTSSAPKDLKNCAKSFYHSSLYHHATTVEAFLQSVREIYTRTTDEQQHSRELRRIAVKAGLQKFGVAMVSDEYK
ncbi:hypothetical protein E4U58_002011, partial [Claviceps cyperi]